MGKISLNRIIKVPMKKANDFYNAIRSNYYLKKVHRAKNHDTIKVGFIVQMPELWDKQSSVYADMCDNKYFEPWLIIVPKYDFENSKIGEYGSEKEFFVSNCLNGKYALAYNENKLAEINVSDFDYLFFQRPYDHYLPEKLRSSSTVCYTKNCYIPYATPEIKKTGIYPVNFFRNIYMGFMEDTGAAQINTTRFKGNCNKGYQHFLSIGYPPFEKCLKINNQCNYSNFLWTPRWSYDPIAGGSHFMEYYHQLAEFDWGKSKLIVRPHPMMWENFVKTGIIEKKQIDDIFSLWKKQQVQVDSNKSIEDTFESMDVLISDKSSVIPMFFLTGKPIIYCPKESEYGSLFSTILPGLYIANTWEELAGLINNLSEHNDPLHSIRKKIIDEHFAYNSSATENIVNAIINDFEESKKETYRK
ncbi:CDP-glycerol glycerophosphotransferase family protein [Ruminococcus flavefaciens]|uniref:CDP-glycerol glycerophosphotransferase family protein n=1 Tax=Ruminococcus flavefaciens TaxID=1265 RepID=UPI00048A6070|nr:CDP-glycerol glycerophosphotransferase family protein [Ruminococcus flavefaciens]